MSILAETSATVIPTGTWSIDPSWSSLEFEVRKLGLVTIKGRVPGFTGTLEGGETASIEGTVDATSITTFDGDRDAHLQSPEFFDTQRYPELRFVSTSIHAHGDSVIVTGDLTIKGVTKPVELTGTLGGPANDPWGNERIGLELGLGRPHRLRTELERAASRWCLPPSERRRPQGLLRRGAGRVARCASSSSPAASGQGRTTRPSPGRRSTSRPRASTSRCSTASATCRSSTQTSRTTTHEAVQHLRDEIDAADAVLFVTPEYNGSIPGVLKNAVDWASRPRADAALRGKTVAVAGASTGQYGAMWAQQDLRRVLGVAGARVVCPDLPVARAEVVCDPSAPSPLVAERLRTHPDRARPRSITAPVAA